jgi:HSP20 family protein
LRRQVERLSERGIGTLRSTAGFSPAIEIWDTGPGFVIRVDLPGVRDEDLDVTLDGSLLSIKGQRGVPGECADAALLVGERPGGRFVRTVALPAEVAGEQTRATLARGVLEIVVPKRSAATRPAVTITVSGGARD